MSALDQRAGALEHGLGLGPASRSRSFRSGDGNGSPPKSQITVRSFGST
jgi:hypothetical protein